MLINRPDIKDIYDNISPYIKNQCGFPNRFDDITMQQHLLIEIISDALIEDMEEQIEGYKQYFSYSDGCDTENQ